MTSFQELDVVDRTLIAKIKEIITDNYYKPMFDMWLTYDADHTFGGWYEGIFKDHYGDFITEDVECRLWFASKNIIYAIKSFIYIKKDDYELDELLDFVEYFVSEQLSQFGNDYSDYECYNWSMIINNEETENLEEEVEDNNETIL
jgi:hypothetical protein